MNPDSKRRTNTRGQYDDVPDFHGPEVTYVTTATSAGPLLKETDPTSFCVFHHELPQYEAHSASAAHIVINRIISSSAELPRLRPNVDISVN